jgi:hypothetical protein
MEITDSQSDLSLISIVARVTMIEAFLGSVLK